MTNHCSYNKCQSDALFISQIYFDKELYNFQTDLLPTSRILNTVYTAIGICHTSYVDCVLARSWPYSVENPDDGQ
jgi:hypothetical protein